MGLFRRIGRAFRSVTRPFRRIGDIAKKALSFVSKPLSAITQPFQKIIGSVLDKLPFGNVIKGFIGQFLQQGPLGLLSASVLGPFGALLGGAGTMNKLLGAANMLKGTEAFANPQGRNNALQMFAAQQARNLFGI